MVEQWKDLPGYEDYYQVSDQGNVRSVTRLANRSGNHQRIAPGRVLRLQVNHRGYTYVTLYKQGNRSVKEVHPLVASVFLGPRPEGYHTHHINKNSTDNRIENLTYVPADRHVSRHHRGEKCHKAILDESQILEVRQLLNAGVIQKDIAQQFGVSRSTIGEIKRGATWKHI